MNNDRERFLLRYTEALLGGDLETQEKLCSAAAGNSELEAALLEIHEATGHELFAEAQATYSLEMERSVTDIRVLLNSHFQGRVLDRPEDASAYFEEEEISPVTVAEVARRLRSEVSGRERDQSVETLNTLTKVDEVLPETLSPRSIRSLLQRLEVDLGRWFDQRFHEAAFHLASGRQEQRLIAARRVRERKRLQGEEKDS